MRCQHSTVIFRAAATVASRRAALARQEAQAREVADQQQRVLDAEREVAEELARRSAIVTPPL